MKKVLFAMTVLLSVLVFAADAPENIPMEEFVARARRTNNVATYAKLHGTLQHRKHIATDVFRPSAAKRIPFVHGGTNVIFQIPCHCRFVSGQPITIGRVAFS